jgi:hypothetical protein
MTRIMASGLVLGWLFWGMSDRLWSQEQGANNADQAAAEAERAKAAKATELKAIVDELQAKLQQARDETKLALAQKGAEDQIAKLKAELEAARAEAEVARAQAEQQRQALEQALAEAKEFAAAAARQRDRAAVEAKRAEEAHANALKAKRLQAEAGQKQAVEANRAKRDYVEQIKQAERALAEQNVRAAQEVAQERYYRLKVAPQQDPNAPAPTSARTAWTRMLAEPSEKPAQVVGDVDNLGDLINSASRALDRAHQEQALAGALQQLRSMGRTDEAAELEKKARALGIKLADEGQGHELDSQKIAILRATKRLVDEGDLRRVIEELRGEVRQLRDEVQGLRQRLEARPADKDGAGAIKKPVLDAVTQPTRAIDIRATTRNSGHSRAPGDEAGHGSAPAEFHRTITRQE